MDGWMDGCLWNSRAHSASFIHAYASRRGV
jgi:hypothetical protein